MRVQELWPSMMGFTWANCTDVAHLRDCHNYLLYSSAFTSTNSVPIIRKCTSQGRIGMYIYGIVNTTAMDLLIMLAYNVQLGANVNTSCLKLRNE